uniref:G-protein coupled receptors family 1 profile domain-containing protein n=1 Tax=Plectus sambesii TaxID=2011161 RepID=A0A914VZC1_9BILA
MDDTIAMDDDEEWCGHDEGYPLVQATIRLYFTTPVIIFGLVANSVNVLIFSHTHMRSQLVNWFFMALSVCDTALLLATFFFLILPVMAERSHNFFLIDLSQRILVHMYPWAMITQTCGVYLTVMVGIHRYLGVCHPFLIRRVGSSGPVKLALATTVAFSVLFNVTRWLEVTNKSCRSEIFENATSVLVWTTELMHAPLYSSTYRIAAYTVVMFLVPFLTLIVTNCLIVRTLRQSSRLRRRMTVRTGSFVSSNNNTIKRFSGDGHANLKNVICAKVQEQKENGITVMLLAVVAGFLAFNALAFINNILEILLKVHVLPPEFEAFYTTLVEVGNLMVNVNSASTIFIYLFFGSKYRSIFLRYWRRVIKLTAQKKGISDTAILNETTFLVVTTVVDAGRKQSLVEKTKRACSVRGKRDFRYSMTTPPKRPSVITAGTNDST